jgi:hypothetical protein
MQITIDTEKDLDKIVEIIMSLPEEKRNWLLKIIKEDTEDSHKIESTKNEDEISLEEYKRKRGIV